MKEQRTISREQIHTGISNLREDAKWSDVLNFRFCNNRTNIVPPLTKRWTKEGGQFHTLIRGPHNSHYAIGANQSVVLRDHCGQLVARQLWELCHNYVIDPKDRDAHTYELLVQGRYTGCEPKCTTVTLVETPSTIKAPPENCQWAVADIFGTVIDSQYTVDEGLWFATASPFELDVDDINPENFGNLISSFLSGVVAFDNGSTVNTVSVTDYAEISVFIESDGSGFTAVIGYEGDDTDDNSNDYVLTVRFNGLPCDLDVGRVYQSVDNQIFELIFDVANGTYSNQLVATFNAGINSMALSTQSGKLYAVEELPAGILYEIDSNQNPPYPLVNTYDFSADATVREAVKAVIVPDTNVMYLNPDASFNNSAAARTWVAIDLNTMQIVNTFTPALQFKPADAAYDIVTQKAWGGFDGRIYSIDFNTQQVTFYAFPLPIIPQGRYWGASFADASGNVVFLNNKTGRIHGINVAELEANPNLVSTFIADGIPASANDGASDPTKFNTFFLGL